MWSLRNPTATPARWDGPACWGNWLEGAAASVPTFLSLVEPACHGLLVLGSKRRSLCPRRGVRLSPAPLLLLPSAVPVSVPTRAHTSRQCLLIAVPVCPHSSFGHLAWQIGAHGKMGKETLRPGWQIGSGFLLLIFFNYLFYFLVLFCFI